MFVREIENLDDSKDFRNIIQHNEIFGFKHKVK